MPLRLRSAGGGSVQLNSPVALATDVSMEVPAYDGAKVLTDKTPGVVLQVVSASTNAVTVNTTTPTTIVSKVITIAANSKLSIAFSSDLNSDTAGAWKITAIYVDGVQQMNSISSTADAAFQSAVSLVWLTGSLAAGNHTVEVKGWQGAGQSTYAENNSNGNSLVIMEIAG